ncbi:MAG TPA: sodium:proton antiporter [Paludibacteraceae bacterium]|nr:sodium:proton antiporter [Paludibacteraceae bacterium]
MLLLNVDLPSSVPLWASIPFAIMLLSIAVLPLIFESWWERNRHKLTVALILAVPTAIYLINNGLVHNLEHQILFDYIPFIMLLASLFVVTGGIHLNGDIKAKPIINTLFLGIGYLLASIMGTTGAAMLLIRPVITTNQQRKYKTHTVLFFIATVANCGGLLTPLGDPPLFLLFLRGAPFTWFLNLLPEWAFVGTFLLLIYFLVDTYYYKKEHWVHLSADAREIEPIRITGTINFIFLLGVILSVAFINDDFIPLMKDNPDTGYLAPIWLKFLREIILGLLIALSLYATKKEVREKNKFSWRPIIEVAVVFLGIFITMVPTMLYLAQNASSFGLTEPWQFYYTAGTLSSFLDNAPTAVAFHGVALGLVNSGQAAAEIAGIPELLLKAIAVGSVFFGAMTYIGNGPNFMVKAIAEENKVEMPSFFGYMFKFSLLVLLPLYILTQLLFL